MSQLVCTLLLIKKNPYNFSAFDNTGESGQEFHKNVHTLFDCMGQLLASNSDKIKSNQVK